MRLLRLRFRIGFGQLLKRPKTERGGVGVAGLGFEFGPVDGAARRGVGGVPVFRRVSREGPSFFRDSPRRTEAGSPEPAGGVLLLAAVHKAVEEGAGGDDDGMGGDAAADLRSFHPRLRGEKQEVGSRK